MKKYTKIANPFFEFALSTTYSAEKAKAYLKKGNDVTNLLLDTSNDLITNNSDLNFKIIDSDLNNKCNMNMTIRVYIRNPAKK